ncbi:uncharacterized protein LAJ45_05047 [Morchella importuna]|uniref:uncharacterized protein n=1 Tax=Morchella importuna TaxID=1174673 RepID=UPI001E8D4624|nr:uncharacterized protein LAJ45_05047 [Morchella importuna]KAH8150866.1 hypothetical protein LAJ45_05047 [Morchella importuna]
MPETSYPQQILYPANTSFDRLFVSSAASACYDSQRITRVQSAAPYVHPAAHDTMYLLRTVCVPDRSGDLSMCHIHRVHAFVAREHTPPPASVPGMWTVLLM